MSEYYHRRTVALSNFHSGWAWFVIFGNGLAGIWALAADRVESLRTRALWWFIAVAEMTIMVQVILGVIMVAGQGRKPANFQMFYGFVAVLSVGLIYSYRDQLAHRRYLLYGFGSLFLMGLGIRAMLVGAPPPT